MQSGETLYAIAKSYGIGEGTIVERNPAVAGGLKAGTVLRIPVAAADEPQRQERSAKAERKFQGTAASAVAACGSRHT